MLTADELKKSRVVGVRLKPDEIEYWEPVANELAGKWSDLLAWGLERLKADIEPGDHNPLSKVNSAIVRDGRKP